MKAASTLQMAQKGIRRQVPVLATWRHPPYPPRFPWLTLTRFKSTPKLVLCASPLEVMFWCFPAFSSFPFAYEWALYTPPSKNVKSMQIK